MTRIGRRACRTGICVAGYRDQPPPSIRRRTTDTFGDLASKHLSAVLAPSVCMGELQREMASDKDTVGALAGNTSPSCPADYPSFPVTYCVRDSVRACIT